VGASKEERKNLWAHLNRREKICGSIKTGETKYVGASKQDRQNLWEHLNRIDKVCGSI
jgi:hypothetical protein